jgi:hypothetical protein
VVSAPSFFGEKTRKNCNIGRRRVRRNTVRNVAAQCTRGDMIFLVSDVTVARSQSVKTCKRSMPILPNIPHRTDFADLSTRLLTRYMTEHLVVARVGDFSKILFWRSVGRAEIQAPALCFVPWPKLPVG